MITFFPKFEEHERTLAAAAHPTEEDTAVLASLRVFLSYIRENYRESLSRIASFTKHGEITFELLYAVLIPGSIILHRCPVTRETLAMRLVLATRVERKCGPCYLLSLIGLEASATDVKTEGLIADIGGEEDDGARRSKGPRFGYGATRIILDYFEGVQEIHSLSAFPIQYHPEAAQVRAMLVSRGRRWADLAGVHHVQYYGMGIQRERGQGELRLRRFAVKSRVMIDKGELSLISKYVCAWYNADTLSRSRRTLRQGREQLGPTYPEQASSDQRWEKWDGVSHRRRPAPRFSDLVRLQLIG